MDDGVVACSELAVNRHKYFVFTDRVNSISDGVSERNMRV